MKRILSLPAIFFLAFTFWAFGAHSPALAAARLETPRADFEERRRAVAAAMEAATVWVVVEDAKSIGVGSGFIVADGFIATNAHVVDKVGKGGSVYVLNERIPVRKAKVVNLIHEDKSEAVSGRDFALLRFDPPKGIDLPALSFNFDVKRMDRVSAWGYPAMATQFDASTERLQEGDTRGLKPAPVVCTEGTVNTIVSDKAGVSILHSASIAGGNSGGPLVNGRGEVVGINTWGYKEEDEGAFLNGAQLVSELAFFLMDNGVTPKLAPGQQMAARTERISAAGTGVSASQPGGDSEGRRRSVGAYSMVIPRGWSVLDEEENMILTRADDETAAVGLVIGDRDGRSLARTARDLSGELDGTAPELDDNVYTFTFTDDGVDTLVVLGDTGDEDEYFVLFVSGDGNAPGVEEILDSVE